jgi:hypothetical protein
MQDLLKDLGVRDQPFPGTDALLQGELCIELVRM